MEYFLSQFKNKTQTIKVDSTIKGNFVVGIRKQNTEYRIQKRKQKQNKNKEMEKL